MATALRRVRPDRTKPVTTIEEAKGDVTPLHRIFEAFKRPLK